MDIILLQTSAFFGAGYRLADIAHAFGLLPVPLTNCLLHAREAYPQGLTVSYLHMQSTVLKFAVLFL